MAKNKKRQHSRTVERKRQQEQAKLAEEKDRVKNRWDPTGRTLLYIDLVLLASTILLESNGVITKLVSGIFTVIGVIILIAALWLLFGKKKGGDGAGKGPRL